MANIPVPQHVQLAPPGPHVLTTAEGFLGLAIVGAKLPVQLRFVLEDGVELHLPLTIEVCQRMKEYFAAMKDMPGFDPES